MSRRGPGERLEFFAPICDNISQLRLYITIGGESKQNYKIVKGMKPRTEECSLLKARLSMENVCASRGEASTSGARGEQRRKHSVSGMILTDEIARCLWMC